MNPAVPLERSLDRCVQCGFCLPVCPTYALFEREESSPRGRIALMGALAAGEVEPSAETLATYSECVGCRACESACPAGVVYEEVLLAGRAAVHDVQGPPPWNVRLVFFLIERPILLELARRTWRLMGGLVSRCLSRIPKMPPMLALMTALPAPRPMELEPSREQPEVMLHRGCLMEVFWEGTNARAVSLLRSVGIPADRLSSRAGCCGALHGHAGNLDTARRLAKTVIETWEADGERTVVSLAGGCSAFMKGYAELFALDDQWRNRAERFAGSVRDLASLLVEADWTGERDVERITYQDSCHLRHGLKVWKEPRALLAETGEFVELPRSACCGSAGVYNLVHPDIAGSLLRDLVEKIEATGSTTVVTSNPGCELQVRMGLQRHRSAARVQHLADYLFEHSGSGSARHMHDE